MKERRQKEEGYDQSLSIDEWAFYEEEEEVSDATHSLMEPLSDLFCPFDRSTRLFRGSIRKAFVRLLSRPICRNGSTTSSRAPRADKVCVLCILPVPTST